MPWLRRMEIKDLAVQQWVSRDRRLKAVTITSWSKEWRNWKRRMLRMLRRIENSRPWSRKSRCGWACGCTTQLCFRLNTTSLTEPASLNSNHLMPIHVDLVEKDAAFESVLTFNHECPIASSLTRIRSGYGKLHSIYPFAANINCLICHSTQKIPSLLATETIGIRRSQIRM